MLSALLFVLVLLLAPTLNSNTDQRTTDPFGYLRSQMGSEYDYTHTFSLGLTFLPIVIMLVYFVKTRKISMEEENGTDGWKQEHLEPND